MKTKSILLSAPLAGLMVAGLALAACNGDLPTGLGDPSDSVDNPDGVIGDGVDGDDDPTNDAQNSSTLGGEDNTFEHLPGLGQDYKDPFEALKQREEEGPPEIRSRLHSCQKVQVRALRNMLEAFGVDMAATGNPDPAGELWDKGRDALGAANYGTRTPEALTWTNSGATKLQDIFVMAAGEIIAAMPNAAQCQVEGQSIEMFDENDQCNPDAVSCLIGKPATAEHVAICNAAVMAGTDIDAGKKLAVASLLAGAHTCE
ncbi:MAG: hypothetical protein KC731_14400 [Myxococcales bacterium]|nr:hypothetical protein [Myxococcales bacterium]